MVPVNQSHVTPTAVSEAGGRPAVPPGRRSPPLAMDRGRIAALVIGVVLVLPALPLLGGGERTWADLTQRDGGYATTDVHEFSTDGSALATVSTDLGSAGIGWLYSPTLLGTVRIRVTPESPGPPLFVGIGPTTDVDRYLTGGTTRSSPSSGRTRWRPSPAARPSPPQGAGLLGRLGRRPRGPDTAVGAGERRVDRRRDERRRAARARCERRPGSQGPGRAVGRSRRARWQRLSCCWEGCS